MAAATRISTAFRTFSRDMQMERVQILIFFTSWWCWTAASMGFYLLPYTQQELSKALGVQQSDIAYANTTSMLSRTVGAIIFGVLSDQYGRKTPLLIDLVLLSVFTICSGLVQSYSQFIALRFLFGITYGGLYGINMAAVLEAVPREARGLVAGITQQGFGAGNLLASGFHLAMDPYGWRSLYFLGGALSLTACFLRLITPSYSVTAEAVRENEGVEEVTERAAVGGELAFVTKLKYALREHWPIFVYGTVLTACYSTLGHGHLDVYPAFLVSQRKLDVRHQTWVAVVLQAGGLFGAVFGGYGSKYSVKWIPAIFTILIAPFLPLLLLPGQWNLLALGAFFFEFFYAASMAPIGNILQMICPHPGIRGAFGGIVYNLGNAISSIAPSIETKLGENYHLPDGTPDFARVIIILAAICIGLLFLTLACMPLRKVNSEWDAEDPNQIQSRSETQHHAGEFGLKQSNITKGAV